RRELRKRHGRNIRFVMGAVRTIDADCQSVSTDRDTISYDILVIAAGTTNNFFTLKDLAQKVYTLKSTSEALRCRNDILLKLERASVTDDPELRQKLLNFVVIGGGPTGVEIAGALGEMKRYVLPREYPSINPDEVNITLIEGSDRLLRAMSVESSADAMKSLNQLMVDVCLSTSVTGFDGSRVELGNGHHIDALTVIWTAGVTACSFDLRGVFDKDAVIGHGQRFVTDSYCRVWEMPGEVYAIGDIAIMQGDPGYPQGHPQLAQPALQMGRLLAKNLNSGKRREFRYRDKGSMATIGRNRAVVDMKHLHLSGFAAWVIWMFIHLVSILGMRNKLTVLINWIWAYFNYSTSLRMLIKPSRLPEKPHIS
ncbi:MAG: FAD-dependent oxidoreductase, partial [Muribaculaceae bacterium]|nr:FAD-dependent oxidoreductase [Muribaculaceae bacterium]